MAEDIKKDTTGSGTVREVVDLLFSQKIKTCELVWVENGKQINVEVTVTGYKDTDLCEYCMGSLLNREDCPACKKKVDK